MCTTNINPFEARLHRPRTRDLISRLSCRKNLQQYEYQNAVRRYVVQILPLRFEHTSEHTLYTATRQKGLLGVTNFGMVNEFGQFLHLNPHRGSKGLVRCSRAAVATAAICAGTEPPRV